MSRTEEVVVETLVNLVRQVPWGPSRSELMSLSKSLSDKASFERGWDNYSTAAELNWQASMHQLAAEARFPRENDGLPNRFKDEILDKLEDLLHGRRFDYDVGELSLRCHRGLLFAIPELSPEDLDVITDELAAAGRVEHPDSCKELRRRMEAEGPEMRF